MPPRENELPEGTDHIINGAMEINGGSTGGGSGAGGGGIGSGGTGGGGIGSGGAGGGNASAPKAADSTGSEPAFIAGSGDGTGGTAGSSGGTAGGGDGSVVEQLRGQASALRDQAGGRVREFADTGKTRTTDALEELSRVFADTADSIDERLGGEYGEYARKAADTVSGYADTLRSKDVDELYGNVRDAVRKSPGVAIGVAAVVGFALARVVKAGFEDSGTAGTTGTTGTTGGATKKSGGSGSAGGA